MTTRYADVRFRVSGGAELKKEITSVNAELGKLKSQLKYTDSQFAGQENTIEALTAKVKGLQSVYDTLQKKLKLQEDYINKTKTALETSVEAEKKAAAAVEEKTKALEKAKAQYGENSDEVKALNKELDEAKKMQKAASDAVLKGNTELSRAEKQYFATAKEVNEFGSTLETTKKYLDEAENSADGCATSIDKFGKVVKGAGDEAGKLGKETADAVNAMATAIVASGVAKSFKEIKDAIIDCINASADFESAMTGVEKTTNLSTEELNAMSEAIKDMSTEIPVASSELANIMEIAGQLGISKEHLVDFTKTMADLRASTNMTAEDAATAMARFVNIMGTGQDKFNNLGSSIVALGNNFATTESEIMAMSLNLAGAGKQANLSEADILGIATALSSVGIEAGKGGTAFSKVITEMTVASATGSEKLNDFADIAGMSADEFQKLFNEDAISAINAFFTGLGNGSENSIVLLSEMGVEETRLRDTMLRLGNSSSLLTSAVEMSNRAFEDNAALSEEANKRYATSESQSQLLANAYNNLKVAIGDELNPALNDLKKIGVDVLKQATKWVKENGAIVKLIVSVVAGLGTFVVALTSVAAIIQTVTILQGILNTTMAGMPILAICAALGTLITVLMGAALSMEQTSENVAELRDSFNETQNAFEEATATFNDSMATIEASTTVASKYVDVLDALTENGRVAEENQAQYNRTVEQLNTILPDLNLTIDETTGAVVGGTEAIRDQITEWQNLAIESAKAEYLKERVEALTQAQLNQAEAQIELTQVQNDLMQAQEDTTVASQKLEEITGLTTDAWLEMDPIARELTFALMDNGEAAKNAWNEYMNAEQQAYSLGQQEKDLEKLIDDQTTAIDEYQKSLDVATQAVADMSTAEINSKQPTEDVKTGFDNAKESVTEFGNIATTARERFENEVPKYKKAGEDTGQGIIDGMSSRELDVAAAGARLGLAGLRGYKKAVMQNSPSKKFKEAAGFDVEGLIVGVKERMPDAEAAYANMAKNVLSAYENAEQNLPTLTGGFTFTINTTDLTNEKIDYLYRKFDRYMLNG